MYDYSAKGILLVLVCDMNDVCRKVELSVVLVPGLKIHIFLSVAAAQKDVKTVLTKSGSYIDLDSFFI